MRVVTLARSRSYNRAIRLLAFSDLHCDLRQAERLVAASTDADVVLAVGDLASVHSGLVDTVAALRDIECPVVMVPGNNETEAALREACDGWSRAVVLHGESTEVAGVTFFGLGGGIPVTPWEWSFDLDEEAAAGLLETLPGSAVLAVHSPPYGHVDESRGRSLGSRAVLEAIEARQPPLALCGHIHESWGSESRLGDTRVVNLGPEGRAFEL